MDRTISDLLERVRARNIVDTNAEDRQIAMAAANGAISDSRVTIETMKAVQTVVLASEQPKR